MKLGKRLNVGCGRDVRPASEGWVNLDVVPLEGVDVVHDMLEFPWPFADETFEMVAAHHVLEHVPHRVPGRRRDGFLLWMEEAHRVLVPGGLLECVVPHYRHDGYWIDPTHARLVHPSNFLYFTGECRENFYTPARFRIECMDKTRRKFGLRQCSINAWHLERYLGLSPRWTSWLDPLGHPTVLRVLLRKLPRDTGWKAPAE